MTIKDFHAIEVGDVLDTTFDHQNMDAVVTAKSPGGCQLTVRWPNGTTGKINNDMRRYVERRAVRR